MLFKRNKTCHSELEIECLPMLLCNDMTPGLNVRLIFSNSWVKLNLYRNHSKCIIYMIKHVVKSSIALAASVFRPNHICHSKNNTINRITTRNIMFTRAMHNAMHVTIDWNESASHYQRWNYLTGSIDRYMHGIVCAKFADFFQVQTKERLYFCLVFPP